jgi:hypothetical protein
MARRTFQLAALVIGAVVAGSLAAVAIGSAGQGQTVTLGNVIASTTPKTNICPSGTDCTYLPFQGPSTPAMQVPSDGTVTSFSINSDSTGGTVQLRVLRPATGGQFTAVSSSSAETIAATGISTFAVSMPVKAGDVIGLDNDSSALLFDTALPSPITEYYEPALADGQTAAPSNTQDGDQLLLSATVELAATTSTTTPTTISLTHPTPTAPGTSPSGKATAPRLSRVGESRHAWHEAGGPAAGSHQEVGTTFSFTLNERAQLTLTFIQRITGRRVEGRCVAQTPHNRLLRSCERAVRRGSLSLRGRSGINRVPFQGRIPRSTKLPEGSYTLLIHATYEHRVATARLSFTILP